MRMSRRPPEAIDLRWADYKVLLAAESAEKPPYRVPSMRAIRRRRPNGFNVVSTFSGCGGSCLGYRMAGFKVLWANEFIPAAQASYRANHPGSILDTRDIRDIWPGDILEATGLKAGEIDIFDGSPPCASFSVAGKREAGWGQVRSYSDTKQRVDDLFFEYVRLLRGLRPRVFVAENVAGLTTGKARDVFLRILGAFAECGYRVGAKVLDAQWLGVPQSRRRLVIVGVRSDLGLAPAFPCPLGHRYTVRDAVGGLDAPVDPEADISRYAIGREWSALRPGEKSGRYLNLIRADFDRPCPAVTQLAASPSTAGVSHPAECRKFSVAELKRLCGFPDDFRLVGDYRRRGERLGRAVPPVMMAAIASTIRDEILCKLSPTPARSIA